jgi:hypothetical protein
VTPSRPDDIIDTPTLEGHARVTPSWGECPGS